MRRFVVKYRTGGTEPWRHGQPDQTVVTAPNVPIAIYEFHRKNAGASNKYVVTEVYEEP